MLLTTELIHTASLQRFNGETVSGATYAEAEDLPCYVEPDVRLLEQTYGSETGLEGMLFANDLTIPEGSRVTVRGRTTYVLSVQPLDDGNGLAHAQVALSGRPPAAALRTSTVTLLNPGPGEPVWDGEKTTVPNGSSVAEDIAARITLEESRADVDREAAEELVLVTAYVVAVHRDVEVDESHLVRVDACPDDPSLHGRTFDVRQVERGSQRVERILRCTLI